MPEIKTRDTVKGTIKTLDRAAVAGERMKEAYVRTKDKAEQGVYSADGSPEEYAADRFSGSTEAVTHEATHQFDKHGRRAVHTTKDNLSTAKEWLEQNKADQPKRAAQKQAEKKAASAARQAGSPQGVARNVHGDSQMGTSVDVSKPISQTAGRESARIKTFERSRRTIKTAGSSRIVEARSVKGTVKTAQRTVKTSERTAGVAIKTTHATAQAAQKSAVAAMTTSHRTAQAAKAAARKTAEMTKAAVKGTASAIRAIIASTKALLTALLAGGWIAAMVILLVVLLGCAFSLFGGGNGSNSYTPVSAEVEAYDSLIRQYAAQHGIPEYVELIKAVMMQESGGRGSDPMQASESGYNTRYPHTPGAITDPEYSISVGVQTLATSLQAAQVDSPIDMERIKLALQGYNFGNGYISWAVGNYGGYSYANAVEFSTMQAQQLGWSSYGDTQYPSHVLRYYPYGRAFTAGGNQAIVEVALTQIGNEGGEPYWSWYGFDSRVEWCACFVSWCADQCGYIDSGIIPKYAGCAEGVSWFQNNGQWQDRSYEPQAGDIIFFDWDDENGQDGISDHVGIVEKVENGFVYTVEGNSGDACKERQYSVGYYEILGYGMPSY
uniref:lysozyme family protein n=1 Tax=Enterocloster clostridioformis TaxID=1531 RepID=UPI0025A5547C|nr:lysozyme family protein [Enterocloster clostridioformis]